MKKLLFGLLAILTMASCQFNKTPTGTTTKDTAITLDGIDSVTAIKMLRGFYNAPGTYNTPTSIWYCKEYIDSLDGLLHKENADGFRVYFARKDDGTNSIFMLSTKAFGPNQNVPSGADHMDYFTHNAAFLTSSIAKGQDDYDTAKGGALLYVKGYKCPENDSCDKTRSHYVSCPVSQQMANSFGDTIKTSAEWFTLGLLDTLKLELTKGNGNGLRIYYAKRINTPSQQHGFILITTTLINKVTTDYFICHEAIAKPSGRHANVDAAHLLPINPTVLDDNGEQCPDQCRGSLLGDLISRGLVRPLPLPKPLKPKK